MRTRLKHVRIWFFLQVVTSICAIGLIYQIGETVLSVDVTTNQADFTQGPPRVSVPSEELHVEGDEDIVELEDDSPTSTESSTDDNSANLVEEEEETATDDMKAKQAPQSRSRSSRKKVGRTLSEVFRVVQDPELFSKSEFGYPVDLLVATQENLERLNVRMSRPERFLPGASPFIPEAGNTQVKYKSCALVGNAGIARAAHFGASIDKHDVVMRINQGPSKNYEDIVGSRTTFRLLNKKWASMYTSALEGRKVFLPNEAQNATILASRVSSKAFEHLASVVRHSRKDISLLYVAQGLESRARNLLKGEQDIQEAYQILVPY